MQIAVIVGFIYATFAVGQFFNKRKPMSYFKAFIAYVLGMISTIIAALAIGITIDIMMQV